MFQVKFASRLSNIIGVEARKIVGFPGSFASAVFRLGDNDIDQEGSIASARLNEPCHQKTGNSEEMVEVILCQKVMSGIFLVVETSYGLQFDNLETILRRKG